MRTWLRTNRRALVALPFLLVLAFAANAQRALDYWWPSEPRYAAAVDDAGYARLVDSVIDANGSQERRIEVRVVDTAEVSATEDYQGDDPRPVTVPGDLRLWRITLHVKSDPATSLGGCQIQVLDAADRQYDPGTAIVDDSAASGQGFACVPADDPGPQLALSPGPVEPDSGLDSDDDARPPEYDKYVYVVMPADREPDRVRVWFELPDYAELNLR